MWPAYCSASLCDSFQALWGCAGILLKRTPLCEVDSDFSPTRVLNSGMGIIQTNKQKFRKKTKTKKPETTKKAKQKKCYVTVAVPASFIRKLLLGKLSLSLSSEHLVANFSHSRRAVSPPKSSSGKVAVGFLCFSKCVLKKH